MSRPNNKIRLYTLNYLRKMANKHDAPIWRRVRELLGRPKRRRIAVNLSKINRYTIDGDTVVVPGKVLGAGDIKKKIVIGAFDYSESAYKKLIEAGCTVLSIKELVERNPRGSGVKIII